MRNRVFDILLASSFQGQDFPAGVEFQGSANIAKITYPRNLPKTSSRRRFAFADTRELATEHRASALVAPSSWRVRARRRCRERECAARLARPVPSRQATPVSCRLPAGHQASVGTSSSVTRYPDATSSTSARTGHAMRESHASRGDTTRRLDGELHRSTRETV